MLCRSCCYVLLGLSTNQNSAIRERGRGREHPGDTLSQAGDMESSPLYPT